MTEPTLTELREMAEGCRGILASRNHIDALRIIEAFLTLTDPTPLTAEHCREAGMVPLVEDSTDLECAAALFCMCNPEETPHLEVLHPTRGTLRLALLQENRDGE